MAHLSLYCVLLGLDCAKKESSSCTLLDKSEEQLSSTNCRLTVNRQLANCRATVDKQFFFHNGNDLSADRRPTVGNMSAGNMSVSCQLKLLWTL